MTAVIIAQPRTRPILFKGEMVQAILEGRKTQTRRLIMQEMLTKPCPFGQIGDTLWVRETFCEIDDRIVYRASEPNFSNPGSWTPCIFMPYTASRLKLKVTDVKTQRLQSISETDALKEGIVKLKNGQHFLELGNNSLLADKASEVFQMLWQFIHGLKSWEANPMVWVITFERI